MTDTAKHHLSVVVVDDEMPARTLLREYLGTQEGVELVAECANGFEAVRRIDELEPDLVLLDIQMPKLDGFEVLELLHHRPQIVFTTAHDEYAIKAFEVQAVDYLLKPFAVERFEQALERARERLARGDAQPLEQLAEARRRQRRPNDRLVIRDGAEIHVVPRASIDYIESDDDYAVIHAGPLELRKKQTLSELEELLSDGGFVRIHRCYLLNVDRLKRIEPYAKDSRIVFLQGGARLPVSRSGYARLKEWL
jgi:two-component system LytT family response regulator